MKELKRNFPKIITDLPEADIMIEGVKGWISQGENHQIIFFQMEPLTEVPEHSHDTPQWGIVVKGEVELTINKDTRIYRKGDEYLIPPHAKHKAKFLNRSRVIDLFGEKARYKTKVK